MCGVLGILGLHCKQTLRTKICLEFQSFLFLDKFLKMLHYFKYDWSSLCDNVWFSLIKYCITIIKLPTKNKTQFCPSLKIKYIMNIIKVKIKQKTKSLTNCYQNQKTAKL